MKMHYSILILGGGVAAVSACEAARAQKPDVSIAILGGERSLPYIRPLLSKMPLQHFNVKNILIHDEKWYEEHGIVYVPGVRVLRLNVEERCVETTAGCFSYDKCIYALGAENTMPPYPGTELNGVCSIRTESDIRKLQRWALNSRHAVVIGGGSIGIEAAYQLAEYGLEVTMLLRSGLMFKQLDKECADYMKSRITKYSVLTGIDVLEIAGNGRANADIAKEAGMEVESGYTEDVYEDGKMVGTFMLGNLRSMEMKKRLIGGE